MFKKLLTVGALAAALIGGIGTASASPFSNYKDCKADSYTAGNGLLSQSLVKYGKPNFANSYTDSSNITWFLKDYKDCGNGYSAAYYEGWRDYH
ncbi:hypothetical protein ABLB69_10880 [Xenorhabdus khoisanae]|uniref:hypothetical protein n=1 Tax=Xenorhabdus khoisanae TaxID=880157 RepID=UPI0032B7EFBD